MPVTTDLDPKKYLININGANISGFADGVFSSFELDENFWMDVTGSDGMTTRIKNPNLTGSLTITLLQSSPSNSVLNTFFNIDRGSPRGAPGALLVRNILGTDMIQSSAAWIKKIPTMQMGKEVSNKEWVIRCADVKVFAGGSRLFAG